MRRLGDAFSVREIHRVLILLLLAACCGTAVAAPVRLAYLFSDGNVQITQRAYQELLTAQPQLRDQVQLYFITESLLDEADPAVLSSADVLVFDVMNEQLLEQYNSKHGIDLLEAIKKRGKILAVGEGLRPQDAYIQLGAIWDARARTYWEHSGPRNQLALLMYALSQAGIRDLSIPEPERSLDFGYYYPQPGQRGKGQLFERWEAFDAWRRANGKHRPGAPRVAVGFYKSTYYSGDTELLDALITEIERQGAEAIPIFGYPGALAFERLLLDSKGEPRADVGLGLIFNFSDFESAQRLTKLDIPVISLISLYGRSEAEWRASPTGLSLYEGTFQLAVPELAGTIAPTVVGSKEKVRDAATGVTAIVTHPIASRVKLAVQRAVRYARLRSVPNAQKRIAVMYYNYPAGKANIGASYLNVAESLAAILETLAREGYDLGGPPASAERLLSDMMSKARNVGGYAPGELQELLAHGDVVRVKVSDYSRWLDEYAPRLKAKILKDWGDPAQSDLMVTRDGGEPSLIIPRVQYGNVVLLPQPARGWGEDVSKLYHAKDLAPHHQYVATYTWLRQHFAADAVVHVGTHGTLEWLDGKDAGLSEEDASDALIADLPDIYIYNVDVVGEGLVARRRGMAALVDHMVPPFTPGGLYPELAALSELIDDHTLNETKNPHLADIYNEQIREQVIKLGLAKDLGLDLSDGIEHETIHEIEEHLRVLKLQNIPYGLHTFGRVPAPEFRASTVDAIVSMDRSALPQATQILAAEMDARIVESGARELQSLTRALAGRFLPVGTGGEPIRNPDVYPTGKNFYGVDPERIPKPAAWKLGVQLADQMLASHVATHGRYPEKVSFVIWGDETMRHEGVLESQIFHLLGTQPVWDARGKLVDVDVVPRANLGRPRVDIVIASAAEGMFNNLTLMLDRAVQKVKMIDEAENFVRRNYLATKATLMQRGYSEEDADRRAGVRIFDEAPGQFNLNTSTIAAASGTWTTDQGMADDYLRKMGHAYGNGFWGESMEDVFRLALSGTEKIVHSSSTMLYGALDNDDMYMYMGGLATAVRSIDGKTPELTVTNTRDPSRPEMTSMDKFIGMEFRSRYINPTWIEGMQKEGYAGAGEMRAFFEYLWGWDATVTEMVDDAMWQETFEVYVQDKHGLDMKEFFDTASPHAYQDIAARMLETVRKEYWNADVATRTELVQEYVDSVLQHGVSCSELTCGNPNLTEFVMEQAAAAGIPVPRIQQFAATIEAAIQRSTQQAAQQAREFVQRNEAQLSERHAKMQRGVRQLVGYVMEHTQRMLKPMTPPMDTPTSSQWSALWVGIPLLATLLLWRRRRQGAT